MKIIVTSRNFIEEQLQCADFMYAVWLSFANYYGLNYSLSMFYRESPTSTIEHKTNELYSPQAQYMSLYSPQAQYMSQWKNSNKYSRLNLAIERDLVKFGQDDTLTSDLYNDKQRKEV